MLRDYRNHDVDHDGYEDYHLKRVRHYGAQQAAAHAVGDCDEREKKRGADEGAASALAVVAADDGGVAPYFVEEAYQYGGRECDGRGAPVFLSKEADKPSRAETAAQAVDDDACKRYA